MQSPGNLNQPVAQRFQQLESARKGTTKCVEVEFSAEVSGVDYCDLQRMRVQVGCLAVQQHGIHAVKSLHNPPRRLDDPARPKSDSRADASSNHFSVVLIGDID